MKLRVLLLIIVATVMLTGCPSPWCEIWPTAKCKDEGVPYQAPQRCPPGGATEELTLCGDVPCIYWECVADPTINGTYPHERFR